MGDKKETLMGDGKALVGRLISLSLEGLSRMLDSKGEYFCYRRVRSGEGLFNEGSSYRYTIISLLGLYRARSIGLEIQIDMEAMLGRILADKGRPDNIGDVGLLLWLVALAVPDKLDPFWVERNISNSLLQDREAREGKTTEMAWFLTGLSYAALKQLKRQEKIKDLAFQTYEILKKNYEGKGIFRHANKESLRGRFRGRVGSFADQVYPIYAFSAFGRAFNHQEALDIAGECASAICNLQGPLGQWWWHYDSKTGKVIGKYPVYSVHQDGMAPMALFAIGGTNGKDYRGPIYKGLEWITGHNELGLNLIEEREAIIWRSFRQGMARKYAEAAFSLSGKPPWQINNHRLKILHECRPYHLGWLLYAFSNDGSGALGAFK